MLYLISDLMELGQGGFSTSQLVATYVAEAAIPLFVHRLYAVQLPRIGRLGLISAVIYAYAFVYCTSTVAYTLVERTSDWQALERAWGVRDLAFAAIGAALLARPGLVVAARQTVVAGRRPREQA